MAKWHLTYAPYGESQPDRFFEGTEAELDAWFEREVICIGCRTLLNNDRNEGTQILGGDLQWQSPTAWNTGCGCERELEEVA